MNPVVLTTAVLVLLMLGCMTASGVSLAWLMIPQSDQRWRRALRWLLPAIVGSAAVLFVYRMIVVHHSWQPLESHVDGLILINVLVGLLLCYLQTRRRMESVSAFVLPVLSMLMAWAVLASTMAFQAFEMGSIWNTFHRLGVYLGSVFYLVAAGTGVMFMYVGRQLKTKRALGLLDRLPSLEAVEELLVQTATLGFALISFGLVTGVIIIASGPTRLGAAWWFSPKVLLGFSAWVVYALVMNMRHTRTFRGLRAAWLAIIGFMLVLATFVMALLLGSAPDVDAVRQARLVQVWQEDGCARVCVVMERKDEHVSGDEGAHAQQAGFVTTQEGNA